MSLEEMNDLAKIANQIIEKKDAEIAKLRAALEQISRYHDCWVHSYHPAEYARRILEQIIQSDKNGT